MRYDKELFFTENLLKNFHIHLRYITEHTSEKFPSFQGIGLQDILNYKFDNASIFQMLEKQCQPNTLYRIHNIFMCHYIFFRLPETEEPVFAYIGPYTLSAVTKSDILKLADQHKIAPGNLLQIEQFFTDLPLISDENLLLTLLYTLGEYLWDGADNFSVTDNFQFPTPAPDDFVPVPDIQTLDEAALSIQVLEQRYEQEQKLMQAVAGGHLHKAELAFSQLSLRQLELRTDNPVRDYKNYAIILNTILRKSAEQAAVHPVQIHEISSRYARKIELITSYTSFSSLIKEMVRKYCLLVKNHSLK